MATGVRDNECWEDTSSQHVTEMLHRPAACTPRQSLTFHDVTAVNPNVHVIMLTFCIQYKSSKTTYDLFTGQ